MGVDVKKIIVLVLLIMGCEKKPNMSFCRYYFQFYGQSACLNWNPQKARWELEGDFQALASVLDNRDNMVWDAAKIRGRIGRRP